MGLEKLPDILQALAAEEVDYVLIGAVAMMAHGLVRGTEDVDFFVRPDAENIARLRVTVQGVTIGEAVRPPVDGGDGKQSRRRDRPRY
ncbi:MAG: hypothetical protein FJW26_17855 [Acidimicrobiia bacterium]|nr:hypothetical protein [Acidimicrobiia bacterium]